jgi:hypothetical protein
MGYVKHETAAFFFFFFFFGALTFPMSLQLWEALLLHALALDTATGSSGTADQLPLLLHYLGHDNRLVIPNPVQPSPLPSFFII